MVKGIIVEMTIKNNTTGDYLRIPVVPPSIKYHDGEKQATTAKILNLGDVDFPDGVALDTIEWASFFPKRYDPGYCAISELLDPLTYRNRFSGWKDQGASLQVIIPAAGINKTMYITSFDWQLTGFEGDIYYMVRLKEFKTVRPIQIAVQVNADETVSATTPTKSPESRPPVPETPKPKTYTVKAGDSLSAIAKRLGIPNWRTIYDNNKGVIGANPNLIKPGQVFKV